MNLPVISFHQNKVLFTADVPDCDKLSPGEKLGRAVEWGIHRRVSFRGADIGGLEMYDADLIGVDLSEAWLTGANLTGSRLTGARFTGPRLGHASLAMCDLTSAKLDGADLTFADMQFAKVKATKFDGAHMSGANLRGTGLIDGGCDDRGNRFVGWTDERERLIVSEGHCAALPLKEMRARVGAPDYEGPRTNRMRVETVAMIARGDELPV